jgi:hypothetical protein
VADKSQETRRKSDANGTCDFGQWRGMIPCELIRFVGLSLIALRVGSQQTVVAAGICAALQEL